MTWQNIRLLFIIIRYNKNSLDHALNETSIYRNKCQYTTLCLTILHSNLRYSILIYSIVLYTTLLSSPPLYTILLYSILIYSTLLSSPPLYTSLFWRRPHRLVIDLGSLSASKIERQWRIYAGNWEVKQCFPEFHFFF